MNVTIEKLLTALDEETAGYVGMEKVLADEEASLSFSRKERFEHVQLEKESLVVTIQKHAKIRKRLIDQLAEVCQVREPIVTVSKLAQYFSAPNNERLLSRANRLRSHIDAVQSKNRHNQQLIHQYLELTQGALKLLTRLIDDNPVYQRPGTDHPAIGYRGGGGRIFCGTG